LEERVSAVVQYESRSRKFGRDCIMRTAWIPIHKIRLGCDTPMGIGDLERARDRVLHNGRDCALWPCPVGEWDESGGWFVIGDGRHEYLARLALGCREIFVAWVEQIEAGP
jgi:hypothetical protein